LGVIVVQRVIVIPVTDFSTLGLDYARNNATVWVVCVFKDTLDFIYPSMVVVDY
jgi:hypothetical protein